MDSVWRLVSCVLELPFTLACALSHAHGHSLSQQGASFPRSQPHSHTLFMWPYWRVYCPFLSAVCLHFTLYHESVVVLRVNKTSSVFFWEFDSIQVSHLFSKSENQAVISSLTSMGEAELFCLFKCTYCSLSVTDRNIKTRIRHLCYWECRLRFFSLHIVAK